MTYSASCYDPATRRLIAVWRNMVYQCRDDSRGKNHAAYFQRGIRVCDEWTRDRMAFVRWAMSNGYAEGLKLVRTGDSSVYGPATCAFVARLTHRRGRKPGIVLWPKG